MRSTTILSVAAAGGIGVTAVFLMAAAARHGSAVDRVDFGVERRATSPAFDARVAPVSSAPTKEFRIPITHDTIEIAPGVKYAGWTFGGTVPGPVLRVRQGDRVRIVLVNEAKDMPHSIDLHAARIPMDHAMKSIGPGQQLEFEFEATTAGVFLVHCGTAPVLMHIAQGMYLPIIVDPAGGWPTHADAEFVLVQSEFFPKASARDSAVTEGDWQAMLDDRARYVVFNGRANQYVADPLRVKEGDRVRVFVVNAGPNRTSAFHIVGTIFDRVYPDGQASRPLEGVQTYDVPAGGGAVFEATFAKGQSGAGTYAFVTHAFSDASKGAVGHLVVEAPVIAKR